MAGRWRIATIHRRCPHSIQGAHQSRWKTHYYTLLIGAFTYTTSWLLYDGLSKTLRELIFAPISTPSTTVVVPNYLPLITLGPLQRSIPPICESGKTNGMQSAQSSSVKIESIICDGEREKAKCAPTYTTSLRNSEKST